jgi:hypothetical protein
MLGFRVAILPFSYPNRVNTVITNINAGDGSTLSPFALENGNGHIASCSDIVKRFYADKYFMSF